MLWKDSPIAPAVLKWKSLFVRFHRKSKVFTSLCPLKNAVMHPRPLRMHSSIHRNVRNKCSPAISSTLMHIQQRSPRKGPTVFAFVKVKRKKQSSLYYSVELFRHVIATALSWYFFSYVPSRRTCRRMHRNRFIQICAKKFLDGVSTTTGHKNRGRHQQTVVFYISSFRRGQLNTKRCLIRTNSVAFFHKCYVWSLTYHFTALTAIST